MPRIGGAAALAPRPRVTPAGRRSTTYAVNLSASFELDIWGRLRRATESARASLLASEQGQAHRRAYRRQSVASGYIQLRALDRQLEIAQQTS
jgi:multidrug efflux system outer membrane protein